MGINEPLEGSQVNVDDVLVVDDVDSVVRGKQKRTGSWRSELLTTEIRLC